MRKRILGAEKHITANQDQGWLDLEQIAEVEISSEDSANPIESALLADQKGGWRAADTGTQIIRLRFVPPQNIRRICLHFIETATERTQEYTIRYCSGSRPSFQEIVRQQWNFSPEGSTSEIEDLSVELSEVSLFELTINPDINNATAFASLAQLRLA